MYPNATTARRDFSFAPAFTGHCGGGGCLFRVDSDAAERVDLLREGGGAANASVATIAAQMLAELRRRSISASPTAMRRRRSISASPTAVARVWTRRCSKWVPRHFRSMSTNVGTHVRTHVRAHGSRSQPQMSGRIVAGTMAEMPTTFKRYK